MNRRTLVCFVAMAAVLVMIGAVQSWSVSLVILNLCLISAVMSLGLNIQWGYAGIFNAGAMASAALGGLACVLVSRPPVPEAWDAGGGPMVLALAILVATAVLALLAYQRLHGRRGRVLVILVLSVAGYLAARTVFDPAADSIEAVDPAKTGYLGGLGLPILLSWIAGGLFAAAAAWLVGRIALGLRSDYLAIATLGIAEIVIATIKNEDWLARGVKNVTNLPRPVPYEVDLQHNALFVDFVSRLHSGQLEVLDAAARNAALRQFVIEASSITVKLCYTALFAAVLILLLVLSERALRSPWGRMMRAIRDNEEAASAFGKDIVFRHRQVFILGSAVIGIAGAMLVTLDGQFTPGTYQPLRFTFLVWVMVIVGGSGNNFGAVLGGFIVWLIWIEAEPAGAWLMHAVTTGLEPDSAVREHLLRAAPHMRTLLMGLTLLLTLRYWPQGILPETNPAPGPQPKATTS